MSEDNQEIINEINLKIIDLIESYQEKLPPYEVGSALIRQAVSMILYYAPTELLGIKTVLANVEIGITEYEETHS